MSGLIDNAYLGIPYSRLASNIEIQALGKAVLNLHNINGNVVVLKGDYTRGVLLERLFRFWWWENPTDELRLAMHMLSLNLYKPLNLGNQKEIATSIWQKSKSLGKAEEWRTQIKQLTEVESDEVGFFFRMYFRISQQILSRYSRWVGVFGTTVPTPYFFLYELIIARTLLLGFRNNSLFLYQVSPTYTINSKIPRFIERFPIHNKEIFLCFEFSNYNLCLDLKEYLTIRGITVKFGIESETGDPIEHLIANKIKGSLLMLALIEEIDMDFGLPIWIYQELDFARKLNIPCLLVSKEFGQCSEMPWLPNLHVNFDNREELKSRIFEFIKTNYDL